MIYNFESFNFNDIEMLVVKATDNRKIKLTKGENLLLKDLINNNNKIDFETENMALKKEYADLKTSYKSLKNKLRDVAKLQRIKEDEKSIIIKIYSLNQVSRIKKNETRKKFSRSKLNDKKEDKYFNFNDFNYPREFYLLNRHYKLVKVYPNFANYMDTKTKCLTSFRKQELINY